MKASLMKFKDSQLSREQMKGVKGGVRCTGEWTNSNGDILLVTEDCPTASVSTCISRLNSIVGHGSANSYSCNLV
ncbi:MAG: hypothetical protein MUF45_03135 [Spirosomaceae bacterium]|jgi:natural product precursor|nr:hypothetical protein [Spirosomataceae bacterium]